MLHSVEVKYQNPSRSRNRNVRPSFRVFVICPKFGDVRARPGSANWGVLERLIASARMVMFQSRGRVQVRPNEAFRFAILPLRKVLRPRLPAISIGARMNRNAERGSNRTEVSGLPIVRPSTEGSTTIGRSPELPSTLPKPGPSDPPSTVKGVPLFSSNTEVRSQLRYNPLSQPRPARPVLQAPWSRNA